MATDFGMLTAAGSMLIGGLGLWMYWRIVRQDVQLAQRRRAWLSDQELVPIRVVSRSRSVGRP